MNIEDAETVTPRTLINSKTISSRDRLLLRPRRAVAGRRPDEPALAAHARAAPLGPRTGRPEPQARRLRGARRAHLALRPHLPDRDAGRHEHRPDRVAGDLRRRRRVRLPHHAVPRRARTARSPTRSSTCAPTRRCDSIIAPADTERDDKSKLVERAHHGPRERRLPPRRRARRSSTSTSRRCRSSASPRALIPFLEHDDANRALMGSNMQRQAVPLLRTEPPVVGTGMEKRRRDATPAWSSRAAQGRRGRAYVDATRDPGRRRRLPRCASSSGLNERTCLNQKPDRRAEGDKVKKGQVIADGAATQARRARARPQRARRLHDLGRLQLRGRDPHLASASSSEDTFTSIHIEEFEVEIRETKLGREEFTRDIPNVSETRAPEPRRGRHRARSARASRRATSWSARSPRRARASSRPKRSCCTRSSAAPART